jgi:gas vesicle protein GvpL/GvpF
VSSTTTPAAETEKVTTTARYCYGVTWATAARPQPGAGVGGASVAPIVAGQVAALASPIESATVRARRRDLLRHSDVLWTALGEATVLPLRFGVVFESEAAIVADFLEPRHDELTTLLRRFEGRVELRVRALYREDAILGQIVRDNPGIARLREATRSNEPAATLPLRIELGELVAAELQHRTRRDAQMLLGRLSPLAQGVDIDEEPIEHQVLRASFLVEEKRVPAFDEAMNELAERESERMVFKYLGPLPPHSFLNLAAGGS